MCGVYMNKLSFNYHVQIRVLWMQFIKDKFTKINATLFISKCRFIEAEKRTEQNK